MQAAEFNDARPAADEPQEEAEYADARPAQKAEEHGLSCLQNVRLGFAVCCIGCSQLWNRAVYGPPPPPKAHYKGQVLIFCS
jgi:hypothetical protein